MSEPEKKEPTAEEFRIGVIAQIRTDLMSWIDHAVKEKSLHVAVPTHVAALIAGMLHGIVDKEGSVRIAEMNTESPFPKCPKCGAQPCLPAVQRVQHSETVKGFIHYCPDCMNIITVQLLSGPDPKSRIVTPV